ncbi:hypothetical protein ZWY2020_036298 [Hordeum vulgare]|nr:hypothetical protein ZWY2020_036298 [Hordeum vulgare]
MWLASLPRGTIHRAGREILLACWEDRLVGRDDGTSPLPWTRSVFLTVPNESPTSGAPGDMDMAQKRGLPSSNLVGGAFGHTLIRTHMEERRWNDALAARYSVHLPTRSMATFGRCRPQIVRGHARRAGDVSAESTQPQPAPPSKR